MSCQLQSGGYCLNTDTRLFCDCNTGIDYTIGLASGNSNTLNQIANTNQLPPKPPKFLLDTFFDVDGKISSTGVAVLLAVGIVVLMPRN